MNIKNLTPHPINILKYNHDLLTIEPSGIIARVDQKTIERNNVDGIRFYDSVFGAVENLPDKVDNTLLIVSSIVKSAAKDRDDLVVPCNYVRDQSGKIIACEGLSF